MATPTNGRPSAHVGPGLGRASVTKPVPKDAAEARMGPVMQNMLPSALGVAGLAWTCPAARHAP